MKTNNFTVFSYWQITSVKPPNVNFLPCQTLTKVFCDLQCLMSNYNSLVHSSPKETQLFWSCLSFREECRSVNFGPNVISAILLITIGQKPHSQIPHRSRTVIKHLSTSHRWNFTKLDASRQFGSCLSFLEEFMSENLHLHNIWHFSTGSFAFHSQEHFSWWKWPGVTDPGSGSQ